MIIGSRNQNYNIISKLRMNNNKEKETKEEKDKEIVALVETLQQLQLQQQLITERLSVLVTTPNRQSLNTQPSARVTTPEPEETVFDLGNKVRIKNPKVNQHNIGYITKIGKTNITVTTKGGIKIVRAPKNLQHYQHE